MISNCTEASATRNYNRLYFNDGFSNVLAEEQVDESLRNIFETFIHGSTTFDLSLKIHNKNGINSEENI